MRLFPAIAITLSLFSTSLLADETDAHSMPEVSGGLLAPGKPSGVEKAQRIDNRVLWVAGIGAVAAGVIILATQGNSKTTTSTTTTTTTQ